MEKNKRKPNNIMSKCKVTILNYSDLTLDLKPMLMINQEKRDQKEITETKKKKKMLKNQKKIKMVKRKNKKKNQKKKAPK